MLCYRIRCPHLIAHTTGLAVRFRLDPVIYVRLFTYCSATVHVRLFSRF
jgi:hypothetical protein